MKRISTNLDKLEIPAEPIEFLNEFKKIIPEKQEEINLIISEMQEMFDKKHIWCLAAKQIGYNKRIFGINFEDGVHYFINPVLTKKKNLVIQPERFLSMPKNEILIARPTEITAVYYDKSLKYEDNKLTGAAAIAFDQMYQLLDGILPSELGLVSDIEQDGSLFDLKPEELSELTKYYKQYIEIKMKDFKDNLLADSTEEKLFKELKFTEDVINDRIQIVANDTQELKNVDALKKANTLAKNQQNKDNYRRFINQKNSRRK